MKEQKAIVERKENQVSTIETAPTQIQKVETKVISMLDQAGTIEFTEEQQEILFKPIDEEIVEIRPDGLIYAPWVEYKERLRQAFKGKCAIIPEKPKPSFENNLMLWGFYLIIDGRPYGYAIGQQEYFESNPTMTYGDAIEGCKSNALMRLCKDIGMFPELWRPSYVRKWKDKFAESYWNDKKQKYLWRRKGEVRPEQPERRAEGSTGGFSTNSTRTAPSPALTKEPGKKSDNIKWIKAFLKRMNVDEHDFKEWLAINYAKRSFVGTYHGNLSFRVGDEKSIAHLRRRMESGEVDGKAYVGYFDKYIKYKKEELEK